MHDKVKKKVESAILAAQKKDTSTLRCPLKCWDIFSMVQAEIKSKKCK
jgi:hypothetical protein